MKTSSILHPIVLLPLLVLTIAARPALASERCADGVSPTANKAARAKAAQPSSGAPRLASVDPTEVLDVNHPLFAELMAERYKRWIAEQGEGRLAGLDAGGRSRGQ